MYVIDLIISFDVEVKWQDTKVFTLSHCMNSGFNVVIIQTLDELFSEMFCAGAKQSASDCKINGILLFI